MDSLSPSEIGALILKAAADGDPKKLREIRKNFGKVRDLKHICDVYSDFSTGRRALHYAAEMGNLVICEILIDNFGAFVDIPSYSGDTPLLEAAKGLHIKVVEYLINHNALHQVPNKKGYTALHYAVLKDNKQLMEILLANAAPTEIDSVDGTPLQIAASLGNLKAVKLLLKNGAEPSSATSSIVGSPLISAIKCRSFECVKCLLKAKADPEKCLYGLSPLSHAAKEKDTKYLLSLLDAGANPDKINTGRIKAIEVAAIAENVEAVRILFPLTKPLQGYTKWTVDGIMKHVRSGAGKAKRETEKLRFLKIVNDLGQAALDSEDYKTATDWYSEASYLDPTNPKWLSIRSMCYARVGKGMLALQDAEESIKLNPQSCPCPKPHYSAGDHGISWQLFKRYHMASIAFILDPNDKETRESFRVALFEYFSWLYLTSCPAELMTFFQHFM